MGRDAELIKNAKKWVLIAQDADGHIQVSGNCDPKWLAEILDVVRGGVPSIKDIPEFQTRIIETN